MMPSPDLERFAALVADNVATAFERGSMPLRPDARHAIVTAVMREVLSVLPTGSGGVVVAACNRALHDTVVAMGVAGPRIAAVDLRDGAVTTRQS